MLACTLAAAATIGSPVSAQAIRQIYGRLRDGRTVERFELANRRGTRVGILAYGGIIDSMVVRDRAGRPGNVVLSLPDLAAYERRANFGSIVGRYAGRISGGGFMLDGRRVALSADANAVVIHGGTPGFGAQLWSVRRCAAPRCASVTLRRVSPDGENGFPGRLALAVTYSLGEDDALRIDYRATTDRPTVVNLTNHSYFNLAGSGDTTAQRVRVVASRYAETDNRRVPTGTLLPVAGTPFDLRAAVPLGDRIDAPELAASRGFDHSFVRDAAPGRLAVVARAADPASGRTLEVSTTEPVLHLYTAGAFDGSLIGADGAPLRRAAGFALETQHMPDSPNQPGFPTTVLRPGQIFRSTTIYRFGVMR